MLELLKVTVKSKDLRLAKDITNIYIAYLDNIRRLSRCEI